MTEADKAAANTYLVRKSSGKSPVLNIPLKLGSTTASYGDAHSDKWLTLTLQVPYLILNPGTTDPVTPTLSRTDWEKVPEANRARIAIRPDLDNGWEYFDENGREVDKDAAEKGLSGIIHLRYVGKDGKGHFSNANNSEQPSQRVFFEGNVPENAGAQIKVGLQCTYMQEGDTVTQGNLVIPADQNNLENESLPRLAIFVNTNLDWDTELELVDSPVLWDKYNYMVYKVTVKNISEDPESTIHHFELNLEPDAGGDPRHLEQKDLAVWKRDENGQIVEADPDTDKENLIGVPEQGGLLIYDVTNATKEQLDELDTDRFSNAQEVLGDPMTYGSNQDGHVNVMINQPDGALAPTGDNTSRSYYVAVPYTTNLQNIGDQQPYVIQSSVATVYFGAKGEYSWSKEKSNNSQFEKSEIGFTQQKRARNLETGALQDNAEGLLDWDGSYVIDGLATTGNVPVYGPDSDAKNPDATGPYVLDTIPKHYELQSIDLQVEADTTGRLRTRDLDDWFDTARGPVQVELEDKDGNTSWQTLGTPTQQDAATEDGATWNTWSIKDVSTPIANAEKSADAKWTGNIRFMLRDELPANKSLPVRIKVNGRLSAPTSFTNTIVTHYGQRYWNPKTVDTEAHYTINSHETDKDTAVYTQARAVAPQVNAVAHTIMPGDVQATEGKSIDIPLSNGVSGWRFELGNTSKSRMLAAHFATSALTFETADGEKLGFAIDTVTVSNGLLEHARVKNLTLTFEDGTKLELTGDELGTLAAQDAETGNAVITRESVSGWGKKQQIANVSMDFDGVDGELKTSDGAWIDLAGQSQRMANYPLTGTFKTVYPEEFKTENKSANDTATLKTMRAQMSVSTHGQYVDVAEANASSVANTDKNQTQIAVPYDRDFTLWAELTNQGLSPLDDADMTFALPLAWETGIAQADGTTQDAWTGFHPTKLTITKAFLDTWESFGEIRFYDATNMDAPALTLTPSEDGKAFVDGDGTRYELNQAGDLVLAESLWHEKAPNLKAVKLYGWKGMKNGTTDASQRVVFDGFEDAALGTEGVLQVRTINHIQGVRPAGEDDPLLKSAPVRNIFEGIAQFFKGAVTTIATSVERAATRAAEKESAWTATSTDDTVVYVSKMAFDAASRAAYYDGEPEAEGARFTRFTTPDDEGHRVDYDRWSSSYAFDEGNKTLEVGYKAIGSYLFDFRQYTNNQGTMIEHANNQEQNDLAYSGKQYAYLLGAKTYNTAATLDVTQELPSDGFDAYYLKIHPDAIDNLAGITVYYSDGTELKATSKDWEDKENALETDADGNKFLRIGLLEDKLDFSADAKLSRDAVKDYSDKNFKDGQYQKRVATKIVYTLKINQNQYEDDTDSKAAGVDFGTKYSPANATNAAIEVTGRFYRDDARSDAKTNAVAKVAVNIGGAYSAAKRKGAVAQTRYAVAGAAGKSSWSYQDRAYSGVGYKMGHLTSTAKVDVSVDSQFVMKGVHDTPKIDYPSVDHDDNVAIGSDQHFSVSYYRMHVPYSTESYYRGVSKDYAYENYDKRADDDWGASRVVFADHVLIEDKLPVIDEGNTDIAEYYGFLTTGLQLVGQDKATHGANALVDRLQKVTFTTKKIVRSDGGADGTQQASLAEGRTITVTAKDLEDKKEANGSIWFDTAPNGQEPAPELANKNFYDLNLEKDEVVTGYKIELANLGGDADGSREIAQTYDGEASGGRSDIDLKVYGRPYVYKGQKKTDVEDATNTVGVTSSTAYAPDTPIASQSNGYYSYPSYIKTDDAQDKAYFLGYLINFQTRASVSVPEGSPTEIYDYEADNNTPTVAPFEVRYQNRPDGNTESERSARVRQVTLKADVDYSSGSSDMYRMRNVYIPKEFVPGDSSSKWFYATQITFKNGSTGASYSLADLQKAGCMSSAPNDDGLYTIDVEKLLQSDEQAEQLVTTYQGLNATDTLSSDYKGSKWDQTYAKPYVSEVQITFEAVDPDIDDASTTLAGGQFLSPDKTEKGFAFSYDGIYVDRTAKDFADATDQGDNWDETSTPTFGKNSNQLGIDVKSQHRADVVGTPVSIDPNTMKYADYAGGRYPSTFILVSNLVGRTDVTVSRGKQVTLGEGANEKQANFFAYDRDENSMTSPESTKPDAGTANNIPNGYLMAGDYIDYTVTLDAATADELEGPANAADRRTLPLEHTQGRLTVPKGQRIVGWEVLENTTRHEVTAKFMDPDSENGELLKAEPKVDYSVDAKGNERFDEVRNLVFSIGKYDADKPDDSQIQPGTGVKLRVITQLTDELETKTDKDEENEPFEGDEPSFANKQLTATFVTTAEPKHGYVQQRYNNNGSGSKTTYDRDVDNLSDVNPESYNWLQSQKSSFDDPARAGMQVTSSVQFYKHSEATGTPVQVEGEFTQDSPTSPGTKLHNDGSPAKLTVSGIENPSRHTQDMTVTVSFMSRLAEGKPGQQDYQAFELTEAPEISYPGGMPESAAGKRKDVLVEYWNASANDGNGAWVTEDKLTETTLPTSAEEAASVEAANRGEGLLGAVVDFFTPDEPDPIGPSERVRAAESKFHNVQAVRWTYYDVPATTDGTKSFQLNDVELIGVGRFSDTRPSTGDSELNDYFGFVQVDLGLTHYHKEKGSVYGDADSQNDAIDHEERIVKSDENSKSEFQVWRRTPILTFHTQTFQTEAQASADWDAQAKQKTGYVPGESFWYKDTLLNMPQGTNTGAPNLEGELINPVIYERIPSDYLVDQGGGKFTLDTSKLKLKWVDHEGKPVYGAAIASVERVDGKSGVETGLAPDYGGSMNYVSNTKSAANGSSGDDTSAKGYFADINPGSSGVTNSANFDLYKITFKNAASQSGSDVVMNVGDRIEVWFEVKAATDGLPQVYLDADKDLSTTDDRSPAYFPRIGEYFAGYYRPWNYTNQAVNPLNGSTFNDGFGAIDTDGGVIEVNNGGVLMDMDALLHDAAFSGDKPEQSDRWEAFDASLTYIPGSSANNSSYGTSGNNGKYLDADSKTGMFQQVRYTPRSQGAAVEQRDQLPKETWLLSPNKTVENIGQTDTIRRDWDKFVSSLRTRGADNMTTRWGSDVPLVWSESSAHLQKAWLAAASDMQPDEDTTDYKAARQYETSDYSSTVAYDPHYAAWNAANGNADSPYSYAHQNKGTVLGKYAAALQYNQDFTTSLQAFNYGDRSFDGVEMLYVMPRGVEPKLADGSKPKEGDALDASALGAKAEVLASVNGFTGSGSDPQVNETYTDVTGALSIRVVQTPYGDDQGYDAPSDPQDPGYYRDGAALKANTEDLSENPAQSSYESKKSSSDKRTSAAYAESSQPWVLKITVKQPLGKWFGRSIDGADPDNYTGDAGYKIRVSLPSHVFANNESGTWNDRLLVTPWDSPTRERKISPASSYFSVMDVDHYEGANAQSQNLNDLQVFGMDYMFTQDDVGSAWELLASSPNMPSVNGYSVLNNSVLASEDEAGTAGRVASRDSVEYDRAGKSGTLWAQTGTRAVMRKPFVRAWNTVGENGITGDQAEYYLDGEFDGVQMNVHVENRYWWDEQAITRDSPYSNDHPIYEAAQHGYATDGGQKGDLVLPVVTTVLPEGLVVVDGEGKPYPTDGKPHELKDWTISTAAANGANTDLSNNDEAAHARFDATVTYETVTDDEGNEAKRFVVRFIAKDPDARNTVAGNIGSGNTEARIPSGGMDTFKFRVVTSNVPNYDPKHPETGRSYENVRTYVSSKMDGYQFLSDGDIAGNPYPVGYPARTDRIVWYYGGKDARLDAPKNRTENTTAGVIPADTIDDGEDTVEKHKDNRLPGYAWRYVESDEKGKTPNLEDYTFRPSLSMGQEMASGLNADNVSTQADAFKRKSTGKADESADDGLVTITKLRASSPRLVAEHAVSFDSEQDIPAVTMGDGEADTDSRKGAKEAVHNQCIGRNGVQTASTVKSEPLQYGDTPWYRATLKNSSDGQPASSGAILHGKLVFSVHLPRQVSFYNKEQLLTNTFGNDAAGTFYVEWKHYDRQKQQQVTEYLTPRQLIENGWYVRVLESPNWGANDFSQDDYAKPDTDTPNQAGSDETAKPRDHEGETLVFEFAAPNDATDEEFEEYGSLTSAMRGGVRADGYFGSGDELTLYVKTRVDNVGEDGIDDLTTDWLADESSFYATVHDLDGTDWDENKEPGENAWIKAFTHVGSTEKKPIYTPNSNDFLERPLAEQLIGTITFANKAQDSPEQLTPAAAFPPLRMAPAVDYDGDGDYTDVYTSAQSGAFTIKKPSASSRIDTQEHRIQVTNTDLGSGAADDARLGAEQRLLLDQAVNTGAAANSFVVDWEVPYHGKSESSTSGPSLNDPRFNSEVSSVSTGVWEIPGSSVAEDATAKAKALAAYEQQLRVYVLIRTENYPASSTDQNPNIYSNVDYPQPGTSADRVNYQDGSWRVVGNQDGYPVRDADGNKTNTVINLLDAKTPGALKESEGVKQVRWVIKAVPKADGKRATGMDAVVNDDGSDALPVPAGFRLAVDAAPDNPAFPKETGGSQEMDELDPDRKNTGWTWQTTTDKTTGKEQLAYDKHGKPLLEYKSAMPKSVTDNAAAVVVKGGESKTLHLNHFIKTPLRYDDTKFMPSERSRAGYYRDKENPYLAIDMEQYYFDGGYKTGYEWVKGSPNIDVGNSRMMKYKVILKNLSQAQMEELELSGTPDTATNPDISAMVPFISALVPDDAHFVYTPSDQVLDNPKNVLNDAYKGPSSTNADGEVVHSNIDDETPRWTYYVDEGGVENNRHMPSLESTHVGSDSVRAKMQLGPDTKNQRQYLSLHFTGPDSGTEGPKGVLEPGQSLVFEFMMPIRSDANTVTSSALLDASGFIHKEGGYRPYIPSDQTQLEPTGLISDVRDANLDGKTAQTLIQKSLMGLQFKSINTTRDIKLSTTQLDSLFTKDVQGAASAPEGSEYTYTARVSNLSSDPKVAENYVHQVIYDVLPYEGDREIKNTKDGKVVPRDSQWHGYLTDLGARDEGGADGATDAIRVIMRDKPGSTDATAYPDGRRLNPADYTIWVGPFKKEGQAITAGSIADLPDLTRLTDQVLQGTWMNNHRDNKDGVMYQDGFVTLKELQEYVLKHPDQEEALRRGVRAIWCQVNNDKEHLPEQGSLELQYDMRTPLNLPKYLGDTAKTAPTDEEKRQPLYQRLAEAVQWNSFFEYFKTGGATGETSHIGELSQAGVVIDAPENRGYLGDYVWLDADWSEKADDTADGAKAYRESKNGRKLLRGVDSDGKAFDNSGALKDLDGDGKADDPGINGVRVELLNEHGLPVNRDGQTVKWTNEFSGDDAYHWVICDPQTGEVVKDATGMPKLAEAGGPISYTTESDYYGNPGYYILSNLATEDSEGNPMKYRLRFTFPEKWANYAVTTTTTGDGVPVAFETKTEEDDTKHLVATTGDITAKPLDYDKDKFSNGETDVRHAAYDANAVSYDIGIGLPVTYQGTVWRDDQLADSGATVEADGYLDKHGTGAQKEERIEGATVSAYEFDPETQAVSKEPALDVFGNKAVAKSDADGRFSFTLKPGHSYVVKSMVDQPLKPTPYIHQNDPTAAGGDNDLYSLHSETLTHVFTAAAPTNADGTPDYATSNDPTSGYNARDVLGLGYVDKGIGYIGDTVWEDRDRDGIQDAGEPGIEGLPVVLEQYWWNADAVGGKGAWEAVTGTDGAPVTMKVTTNAAGSYVFRVPTYIEHPADADGGSQGGSVLTGYRVRIDNSALKALGYATVITHQDAGTDDELDSDLSNKATELSSGAATHYMDTGKADGGYIVVATPADDQNNAVTGPDGEKYDLSQGLTRHDVDAGLARVDTGSITGLVWEDADRDGLQDTEGDKPETGKPGQTVLLDQYYLDDGTWKRNATFGADGYTTGIVTGGTAEGGSIAVQTDDAGKYRFDNLPTAHVDDAGKVYLAGYRLRLQALDTDHLLTSYHASLSSDPSRDVTAIDSDASGKDLKITDRESYTANDPDAGTRKNDGQVILAALDSKDSNALVSATDPATKRAYDALRADDSLKDESGKPYKRGGDVGEIALSQAKISGILWNDANNDGIRKEESGVPGIQVKLQRYIADSSAKDGWKLDETFGEKTTTTDEHGRYEFDNLDAATEKSEGGFTVYGYRVALSDPAGVKDTWHIGRYHQGKDAAVDSDLMTSGDLVDTRADEILVLLDKATDFTAEANRVEAPAKMPVSGKATAYDVAAPHDEDHRDGALLAPSAQSIAGYLWHDADHDGIRETGEEPLTDKGVTLKSWVLRDGTWEHVGVSNTRTDSNGRYSFDNLPVSQREDGRELLLGYTLTANGAEGANSVAGLPVTAIQVDSPELDGANSKVKRPAAKGGDFQISWNEQDGATKDRRTLDGKIVLAGIADKATHDEYRVDGFDVTYGADELRMNAGFGPFPTGALSGIVWNDESYDGLQDLEKGSEKGMPGVAVRVTQWYQAEDGTFVKNEAFGPVEVKTGTDGRYTVDNLPVYVQMRDGKPVSATQTGDDDFRLAAYRVELPICRMATPRPASMRATTPRATPT